MALPLLGVNNNSALLGFFLIGGGTLLVANVWWGFALIRCAVRRVRGAHRVASEARRGGSGGGGGANVPAIQHTRLVD